MWRPGKLDGLRARSRRSFVRWELGVCDGEIQRSLLAGRVQMDMVLDAAPVDEAGPSTPPQRPRLTLFVAPLRRLAAQTSESQQRVMLDAHHKYNAQGRAGIAPLRPDLLVFASDLGVSTMGVRRASPEFLGKWLRAAMLDIAKPAVDDKPYRPFLHALITTYTSCPTVLELAETARAYVLARAAQDGTEKFWRDRKNAIFDIVIADEAHYAVGGLKKPFAAVHRAPALHRLYLTATPRIFIDNKTKTGERWNDIKGASALVDDEEPEEAMRADDDEPSGTARKPRGPSTRRVSGGVVTRVSF